jgi:hypothetical protein
MTEVLMVTEKVTETTEALEAMLTSSSYGCSYCFGGPPLGSWRSGPLFCASYPQQMTLTKQIRYQQKVPIALRRGTNPSASGMTIRNEIQSRTNTGHGLILIADLGTKEVPLADDKDSEYCSNKHRNLDGPYEFLS